MNHTTNPQDALTQTERDMLRYALDLAQDQMLCVGDEFSEDDHAAIDSLRRLTTAPSAVVSADRATLLREAADIAEDVAESLRKHHEFERSTGALDVMTELRRRAAEEQPAETQDTLPAWLAQRFDPRGADWDGMSDDDRSYWEHQARAVRRAVERGGFKPTAEQPDTQTREADRG